MRKLKLITLIASMTAGTLLINGCSSDRNNQSASERRDDAAITTHVQDRLAADSIYKYPDVQVTTLKGTVQLSGFVKQKGQKERAGELAKSTPGVKDVVNNITVKE